MENCSCPGTGIWSVWVCNMAHYREIASLIRGYLIPIVVCHITIPTLQSIYRNEYRIHNTSWYIFKTTLITLLVVTVWAKTSIVCTSNYGHLMVYKIYYERHRCIKFTGVIKQALLFLLPKFEVIALFLADFTNHWMTEIRSAN